MGQKEDGPVGPRSGAAYTQAGKQGQGRLLVHRERRASKIS